MLARVKMRLDRKARRKRDKHVEKNVKLVSSPSSLDHLKVIEVLGFKDQYFLAASSLPPMFVDYKLMFNQLSSGRAWEKDFGN